MMMDYDWQRIAALYVPLALALIARLLHGRQPRLFVACLLSLCWTLPSLVLLQRWNAVAGWWDFPYSGGLRNGVPAELLLGWVVLWGLLPQLALPRLSLLWTATIMLGVDLVAMPMCPALVHLRTYWLVGEGAAVLFVLLPALCLARWTQRDTHLTERALLQIAASGMLFLFLLPNIPFSVLPVPGWETLLRMAGWKQKIGLQIVLLLALPGVAAVMEFAGRGSGTPISYDPPKRLVTSGIYRYIANPMQGSCAIVMFAWAAMLQSWWMFVVAAVSIAYSAGIAEWDEREDLGRRFGDDWRDYRKSVRSWWPRWRPYHAGPPAVVYIAGACGPCREVRAWIEARGPLGLQIVDAETLPQGSIRRMRYDPQDHPGDGSGVVDGVRAFGRVLEHLNLGWALAGAALRLPGVWQFVQLLMDASGLGPRSIKGHQRPQVS